ncbi:tetratricopeptide repeat protein [Cohnella hashimotonis]|uniref:SAM-dependent methyltransferase n=1 Tax=Cohnella hashimotonis TaxID=2826895 RepID=A0ABT6TGN2_9BACL|nr:tetratricopeptide repeat protein [Cohnella hashimotonis]MDI4645990.1 SAM-dependent methyltransferase [Cohnella hashimotonis]
MAATDSQKYRFSEAPVWELQRAYYEQLGLKAWNNDQVPQYITSNPMIGAAYAEMIFGFLQDRATQGATEETVTLVELGAGAGRLAYHVLHELALLKAYAGIALPPLRYVMTDLALKNVEGWRRHPALANFIDQGALDLATFDAERDTELKLLVSGETIAPGQLRQPLLIVANYFFDAIPQELIYIGEGLVYDCDVVVGQTEPAPGLTLSEQLRRMTLTYEHRRAPRFEDARYPYRDVIALYQRELEDSHVLFPEIGLRCLERLGQLSRAGFAMITADKGDHRLDNWRFAEPPQLVHHGSISLTANYHAIQHVFESRGAEALFTDHHYKNINVACILMLESPKQYVNTRLAYRKSVARFGPDDFFSLKLLADREIETLRLQQILAFWRLGGYDAEWFIQTAKRISSLLADANDEEKLDLRSGIHRMWTSFYVMPQRYDLALDAGLILFEMDMYEDAKPLLDASAQGDDDPVSTVYFCLAICSLELGQEDEARAYLQRALELEPDHEEALTLLAALG